MAFSALALMLLCSCPLSEAARTRLKTLTEAGASTRQSASVDQQAQLTTLATVDVGGEAAHAVSALAFEEVFMLAGMAIPEEWYTVAAQGVKLCTPAGWEVFLRKFHVKQMSFVEDSVYACIDGTGNPEDCPIRWESFNYTNNATEEQVLWILPTADHNNFTAVSHADCYRLLMWAERASVTVRRVSSVEEASTVVKGFTDGSVVHAVLSGHGMRSGMQWGNMANKSGHSVVDQAKAWVPSWARDRLGLEKPEMVTPFLGRDAPSDTFLQLLQTKLELDARVIIYSCLTGRSPSTTTKPLAGFIADRLSAQGLR
jgi:hypothetical protein